MFVMFINDLINTLEEFDVSVKLFADDVKMHVRVLSNCDVSRLQRALNALADFVDLWQLSISFSKCSALDIGKKYSTVPLAGRHIRNNVLNVTRTNVDLGITVTDDLKPRAHVPAAFLNILINW